MMQLMSIQWERANFLPAGATFLGHARAMVQLFLKHYGVIYIVHHNRDYFLKVTDLNPTFTN